MAEVRPGPDPVPEPERGIRCRHCGCGHFWVIRTSPMPGGRVMRQRECRHCGKRVMTYEKAFG